MNRFRRILYSVESALYLVMVVFGILSLLRIAPFYAPDTSSHPAFVWDHAQARTVTYTACCALLGIWWPPVFEKIFGTKLGKIVDLFMAADLFAGIFLGEACQIYYHLDQFDKFLHVFGAAQISIAGYAICKLILKRNAKEGKHLVGMALTFAFFFAVAVDAIWEIYEFSADMILHTNMQKYVPPEFYGCIDPSSGILGGVNGELWNTTNCAKSAEDFHALYSSFQGYHYAIEDTMGDIVADVVGAAIGVLVCALLFAKKPYLADSVIMVDPITYARKQERKRARYLKKHPEEAFQSSRPGIGSSSDTVDLVRSALNEESKGPNESTAPDEATKDTPEP